ncbi:MAG: MCE family protein [Muribaculaceae bacterium]|jgi:phospholipid/cholesterol/gamma-HCH transport system substrate-binding protein|nr:MCE family protein [Muribaculaceae bacterium]MBQ1185920.1 MCE family protein [Muribaculaceae bacterium]MBQ2370855.1 MCE family protein [Muribaculaceae bacterium]MBQ2398592.1 MCE family protein [Muribaculaceae bacterium]MBQ5723442.1 MCE family protein [Muribaculaceae bacterium]
MKKIATKEFIIGLCVMIALVVLFFGIDFLRGINLFQPTNYYHASYSNVAGLEVAAPVTVDGYKVGQVREINFNYENPGIVDVVIAVDEKLSLPVDSRAVIESGLMSGASVKIIMGKESAKIPVGGEVQTAVIPDLMSALSTDVMPNVGNILAQVDSLVRNLNTLIADPALANAVKSLDAITANVELATVGLNNTMNNQLPGIMDNAGKITTNLDVVVNDLAVLSAQLKALPLQSTMDNVNATTANLSTFSAQLNDKNSTLGMLMNDPQLYNQLNRVTADIDSLIVDIKRNPKRYISIKLL